VPIRWLTLFLDLPADDCGAGVAFWTEVTGSELSPWRGADSEFATLLPPQGDPYLRVQRVREGAGGSHLDLHIDLSIESLADAATRAAGLGAGVRRLADDLVVISSPGGFTACLVPWDGESMTPNPFALHGGPPSRLDQLCLDIPPDAFEREGVFWQRLTGWEAQESSLDEFSSLVRPTGIPIRLLFQRRKKAGEHDGVTAHIDFACTDTAQLAQAHAALGARALGTFPHWVTMADPTGRRYCLTKRPPNPPSS
jgi:hypothetical protein